jgi:hypothetical protein
MTVRARNILIIVVLLLVAIVAGTVYLANSFFSSFAPNKITITKTEIISSDGFINPVTIEKLRVDSIGKEQRPVRYLIEQLTTCGIKQVDGKPPIPLKTIKLSKPGRYNWSEENVNIPIAHTELSRTRMDSIQSIIWSTGQQKFDICPIKFETGNWYFVTFLDPQIVGVYIYVDNKGELRQYTTYSGVSPI